MRKVSSTYASGVAVAMVLAACGGGGGDGGGGGGGGSYSDIADAIASPSGTVDANTAPSVATEFEASLKGSAGTSSKESGTQEMACPSGGSMTTQFDGDQSGGTAETSYDACCYQQGCCYDGSATSYFQNNGSNGGASATDGTASYSFCVSANLTFTCGTETPVDGHYEYCYGPNGITYVVKVKGDTFAVSGSYSNGNGTLEITGKNGKYTCTYTNGSGSCTGDAGDFSF